MINIRQNALSAFLDLQAEASAEEVITSSDFKFSWVHHQLDIDNIKSAERSFDSQNLMA